MIIDGLDEFLEKVAREAVQGDLAQGGPTAQPGSELVPHLEFTAGGRLSVDSAASAAVNALQGGIVAEKVMALESLYQKWRYPGSDKKKEKRAEVWEKARKPLMIFRSQIAHLAMALQESLAKSNAAQLQSGIGADYLRVTDDLREMRKFLLKHFPEEISRAESLNTPILEVCKQIMLREPLPRPEHGIYQPLGGGQ